MKHWIVIPFSLLALVLCSGCVKLGESSGLPVEEAEPTPVAYDRINCDEILGTAFNSTTERAWFEENCSKWPAVKVSDAPAASSRTSSEPPECAAIRGKPYESNAQRTFFLQNCNQSTRLSNDSTNSDRTSCDQIRGTSYRSNTERDWYNRNCTNQPAANPGPDRVDCNAIRGSSYRSPAEREWYLANCRN